MASGPMSEEPTNHRVQEQRDDDSDEILVIQECDNTTHDVAFQML